MLLLLQLYILKTWKNNSITTKATVTTSDRTRMFTYPLLVCSAHRLVQYNWNILCWLPFQVAVWNTSCSNLDSLLPTWGPESMAMWVVHTWTLRNRRFVTMLLWTQILYNKLVTGLFPIHLSPSHITYPKQTDMESAEELKRDCAHSMTSEMPSRYPTYHHFRKNIVITGGEKQR